MDKRYKVGDVVRIVHDNQGRAYGYAKAMSTLVDTICTVIVVMRNGVRVKENEYSWAFESIELANNAPMPIEQPKKALIKPVERVKKKREPTLRTRLTKACSTQHGVSSAAMVGVDAYGKPAKRVFAARICHAFVREFTVVSEFYENINAHYRVMPVDLRPSYVKYVNYILKRSPWAKAFLTKSFGVGLRYNIAIDCSLPRQHIMSAITALRMGSEFPEHLKLFTEMVKKYGEDYAFIIASTTHKVIYADKTIYTLDQYSEAHAVFDVQTKYENLVKFFKEGFPESKDKAWKDGHGRNDLFLINALVHYKDKGNRSTSTQDRGTAFKIKVGWSNYTAFTEESLAKEVEYWKTL